MNYYRAVEKKPEHGGGWVFMQLNRREGAAIYCSCNWTDPGHATAAEAERCFYDRETARGVRWTESSTADRCVICNQWTPQRLQGVGNLVDPVESVCRAHFDTAAAAAWLWDRHPFRPGIQIMASW